MSTRYIQKNSDPARSYTGEDAGIGVDSDDNKLYFNPDGTLREVIDASSTQTISGDKTFTGTVVMSGAVSSTEFGDGTVSAPSVTFSADLNTGLYRIGADNLGVTVGGAKAVDIGAGATSVVGSITSADATTPSLATASGKVNTGNVTVAGKTSGSLKITTADATAQAVTVAAAAQTSGASTLTIPDQAGVSSNFVFDTLAQTLTNKTLTSPVVNTPTLTAPSGSASTGVMITKQVAFTENATNTTHTGTVVLPAGAWIHNIEVTSSVLWGAGAAVMKVGDSVDDDGYFVGVDLKATDLLVGEVLSIKHGDLWGGKEGAYLVAASGRRGPTSSNFGPYQAAGTSIIGVIAVTTPGSTAGRTFMNVTYSVGEAIAAVASGS
jgi:hypothetical protein